MRKLLVALLLLCIAIPGTVAFIGWTERRSSAHYLSDLRTELNLGQGMPSEAGNLLSIRPQLFAVDYQSPAHLRLKLDAILQRARASGLLTRATLVALPDHIGTWLIATHEKTELYQARNRQEVRDWMLLGNPLLSVRVLLQNLDAERLDEALLRMKAARMAEQYQALFAGVARDYQVTLLAGSILLPDPEVRDGRLRVGDGPLRNISLVFSPTGEILGQPFSEPWPRRGGMGDPQRLNVMGIPYRVERDWSPGYPQSQVFVDDSPQRGAPLYLRGRLSWPVGGASRRIELTPSGEQAGQAPASQLFNQWIER